MTLFASSRLALWKVGAFVRGQSSMCVVYGGQKVAGVMPREEKQRDEECYGTGNVEGNMASMFCLAMFVGPVLAQKVHLCVYFHRPVREPPRLANRYNRLVSTLKTPCSPRSIRSTKSTRPAHRIPLYLSRFCWSGRGGGQDRTDYMSKF